MAGTGNVTGRAAKTGAGKTPARKSATSPKTVVPAKTIGRPAVTNKVDAPAEKLENQQMRPVTELPVPELTAADIAASQEKTKKPVAPKKVAPVKAAPKPVVAKTVVPKPVAPKSATPTSTPIAPRPAPFAEPIEQKGKQAVSDVLETTKKVAEDAKERLQSAFADASEKAKSGMEKSTKAFEELSTIAKGNVEALVESSRIATKGLENLGQEAAEYGRANFEKASAAMKSLSAARSPAEFFQIQSELFSSSFDTFAKESAKASENLLKLAGDIAQPISTRVSVVTDKVKSKLSA
ncbi:MAG: phasin family protein [Sphingobium sp.]|nr:phasin family protein [Sphingobium sp.]